MRNMAEVQGIGIQLAFHKSDRVGLGLAGSHFHTMASLHKNSRTRHIILSTHASFLAKHSTCTIRTETHHLDERVSPELCKGLLPTTYATATNINTKRDLFCAFLKKEHRAEYTNVTSFHYPNGDEGFRFTTPMNKMHTIYNAFFELEDVYHHFAHTFRRAAATQWPLPYPPSKYRI